MANRMIFVNLAVANVQRSIDFFSKLGFSFNPQFTGETAACMVVNDQAFAMLLARPHFQEFTSKRICETATSVEVLTALSCESREEVDQLVSTALANGGSPANPSQDLGFMYSGSFQDPDGHTWEVLWMDPAHVQPQE